MEHVECVKERSLVAPAGAILVKAAVLTVVERLHAAGIGRLYSGWPQTWQQVMLALAQLCAHSDLLVTAHEQLSADSIGVARLLRPGRS